MGARLETRIYRAVRWNAAAMYGVQIVRITSTLVLARLLAPEDYGLLAMALVVTNFLQVFRELGIRKAIIQAEKVSQELLSTLFFVAVAFGTVFSLGMVCAAPLVSSIYIDQRINAILAVLGSVFMISSISTVSSALLSRTLSFHRLACAEIIAAVVNGIVAISLACLGWRVWALVLGSVSGSIMLTMLTCLLHPWRPTLCFRWAELRKVLSFSLNLTGYSIFDYFAESTDKFIIGLSLGAIPLGVYSLAFQLITYSKAATGAILIRVLLPVFAQIKNDDQRLKRVYLRANGAIALVSFPLILGLMVLAGPFVETVLTSKWSSAKPLICIFAAIGLVQTISMTTGPIFIAKGRTDWMFRWGLASGLLRIVGFLIGVRWGIIGVAISFAITSLLLAYPSFHIPFLLVSGLRVRDLIRSIAPYGAAAGIMALLVGVGRLLLEQAGFAPAIVLAVSIALGMVSYTAILLCTKPPAVSDFLKLLPFPFAHYVKRRAASAS